MKLSCTHENLATTLGYLEWVVGRQTNLPILSNILFEAEEGRLRLLATNLEIGVVAELGAKVERGGKAALPAKLLTQFVQNLDPQEVVHITQEGNRVILENGSDEIKINSVESKDFPLIPEHVGVYPVRFLAGAFHEALRRVAFAVSANESRIELTGVFLSVSERGMHVAATDSFRLAEAIIAGDGDGVVSLKGFLETEGGVILPVDTLLELGRVLQSGVGEVSMALEENQVFFEVGGVRIVSRIIQGRYPDYQQILPKEFQFTVPIAKIDLVRALKMATSFAQYGSSEVTFRFSAEKGVLDIVTSSTGIGEQRTTIHLSQGLQEDREMVFQPRHVLEGVNALQGETITFHLNGKDMPVLLTGENPKEQLYLVMPIRK